MRLLVVDPVHASVHGRAFGDLPRLLSPNDLLVVNDAATLPASLVGHDAAGAPLEVRLVEAIDDATWRVVAFGAGDWRTRTEDRPPPPTLRTGDRVVLGSLGAKVVAIDPRSDRLIVLRFDLEAGALLDAIYRHGRPIQYSHLRIDLDLWDVQTIYAARPWAVEMPSAGRPLTHAILERLRERGISIAALTHAAGLSATGDAALDAALPLPERYEIPAATADAIAAVKREGGRVIAVGTSVVRALESSARSNGGLPRAEVARTELVLGPDFVPRVVDGIVSGIHEPGESHHRLLGMFAPQWLLDRALAHARAAGFHTHEFGDTCLIAPLAA